MRVRFPAARLFDKTNVVANALSKQSLIQETARGPDDAKRIQRNVATQPWIPFVLRRWVLIVFATILLFIVISLEVVQKVCNDDRGFGPIDSNLHYVWTYGPTAVFTLAAAFWTQVDYRTRLIQPWEELARKPQSARRNLFLDYISPHPFSSFYSALRFGHWPVLAALFGSLAFKALVVISTGLFVLNTSNEPIPIPIVSTEQFQNHGFDGTDVDFTAVSLYKETLVDRSSYPKGTNAEYAVEMFKPLEVIQGNSYNLSATVRTFTSGLDCEPATLESNMVLMCQEPECETQRVYLTAENSDCRFSYLPTFLISPESYQDSWYGEILLNNCDADEKIQNRKRLVVIVLFLDPGPTIKNSTTLFCKPHVSMQQSAVTIDEFGAILKVEESESLQTPHDVNVTDFSFGVFDTVFKDNAGEKVYGYNESMFHLGRSLRLALSSQGSKNIEDFSNIELLAKGAHEFYQRITVQLAKQYLMVANTTGNDAGFKGIANWEHQRLFVRTISLRIVEALLCVLVLLSICLALRSYQGLPPRDVASIARVSSAISQSKVLIDQLSATGSWSLRSLRRLLQSTYSARYRPTKDNDPAETLAYVIDGHQSAGEQQSSPKEGYWQPLMISWYIRLGLLALPLAIVIALETLLRLSYRDSGFLDVIQNKQTQLSATIVPALVMALTKLLYSGYDFNLRLFDPFVQLHNRSATAKSSVLNKTIYTWKTDAFWNAFMNKRYAVGASALSVTIASFLTIAASGLYTAAPISRHHSVDLVRLDQFSYPGNDSVYTYDDEAMVRKARLVAYGKIDSSNWTHDGYVLPTIAFLPNNSNAMNTTSIDLQIPVHKGVLDCILVPSNETTLNYTSPTSVDVMWPGIIGCSVNTSPTRNGTQEMHPMYSMTDGPFGRWALPFDSVREPRPSCPTAWGVYGNWSGQHATEINMIQCWSSIQEFQASVRLSMPDQRIKSLIVDERTNKTIMSGTRSNLVLQEIFPKIFIAPLDGFFSVSLFEGATNALNTQLTRREKYAELNARVQKMYSLVTAEILSTLHRDTKLTTVDSTVKATATYSIIRLRQNEISTRILQGLLVWMMICAVVSLFTVRLSRILPKNPCSIAAQVSLVAGSQMLSGLPSKAQWMDDKEFNTLFEDEKYAMGWSVDVDGTEQFRVDVDKSSVDGVKYFRVQQ